MKKLTIVEFLVVVAVGILVGRVLWMQLASWAV